MKPEQISPTSAAQTNTGRRANNEDSYLESPQQGLWLVADGMGGAAAGEIASKIAVESVGKACAEGATLVAALENANLSVRASHTRGIGTPTMGSTIVAARVLGSEYEVAWVGDSRAYLYDGNVRLLTHDHSLVQRKIDEGILTPGQARVSPERNIITQCLGGTFEGKLQIDTVRGNIYSGQRLILCSDGLVRDMSEAQMAEVLSRYESRSDTEAAAALVEAAGGASASDNVTVVVISQHGMERSTGKRSAFLFGIAISMVVFALLMFFSWDADAPWHDKIRNIINQK